MERLTLTCCPSFQLIVFSDPHLPLQRGRPDVGVHGFRARRGVETAGKEKAHVCVA